ncbi:DUF899 domain-containing protein [Variovorax sp. dw_308]|uniref:DUF899 domain-containing protein n=1 Tax=Variovorax sp. dw_308 TaxID=2721546 RepID=UPI001C444CD1|nr:DUF899 domain-containing protein [Variovorax sp. dw_308]
MNYPAIVSRPEWQAARDDLLKAEKELMRAHDALNARRRRLPMTEIVRDYRFASPTRNDLRLVDLFEGRDQLIIYHNMLNHGSDHICPGCSKYSDNLMNNFAHLHARRTSFTMVSRAKVPQIERVKARMGWTFPWVSCHGTSFHEEMVTAQDNASFGLSVFMRQGDRVFQSWFTSGRGVEQGSNTFGLLDLTPWGRQEAWEQSPPGWPQEPTYGWLRLHDEYPDDPVARRQGDLAPHVVPG